MKIAAVIGASSMLGAELIRQLQADGVEALRVGRCADSDVVLDLDQEPVAFSQGLPRVDAVFHCAAAFSDDSESGQWANGMTNVLGGVNVLALMRHLQCTTCIYAGSISSAEGVEVQGRSSYGLSKALGEQVLAWGLTERQSEGIFCSIRFPQIYDVQGRCCRRQAWFGRIVAHASRGIDLSMPAPGGPRNFMHVQDAAQFLIRAQHEELSGVWHASHPESLDYLQVARRAYAIFDAGGEVTIDPAKEPFRAVAFPSGTVLFERLHMTPDITMVRGLGMIRDAGCADVFGPMDVR